MAVPSRAPFDWQVSRRPIRLGCLTVAVLLTAILAGVLAFVTWLVRPQPAIEAYQLIGKDVDGLAVLQLNRSSRRMARFLEVIVRPLSYDVQSHPEQLQEEISQLLDVLTFRRAIGLLRHVAAGGGREQWAWVVPLKRMSDPMKVLIKQLAARDETKAIETVTSGGALLFWSGPQGPFFAIAPRAVVVASDLAWLDELLRRIRRPLEKTPRANRLGLVLPEGGKHCLARAFVLLPAERWQECAKWSETAPAPFGALGRLCRLLQRLGLGPGQFDSAACTATVEPRGRVRFDLRLFCRPTSMPAELGCRLFEQWSQVSATLLGADVESFARPTTTTNSLDFTWRTPPIEQLLGLGPGGPPVQPSSD